ncbi:MAG: HigA family addiction module antidote protein [Labilithrix sp.]|nr:HigA family addiction module antidote protein [Labilithrix sp.]MBX3211415.1 HigA family addiction module antidote protein [Labilithrix sp.]
MKPKNGMRPIHPGEVLREEFLVPLDLSANKLAAAIDVPTNRITEIVAERRNVTADTALRLARAFGTTAEFWMNLQQAFELRTAERESGPALLAIQPIPLPA